MQILRATTAAQVVAVDPRPDARVLASDLGAHRTAASVEEAMAAPGADVVLDFVGSDETMAAGASALVPGGRLVVVGGARGRMVVGKGLALPLGWQVSAPFWGSREDLVAVIELAERGLLAPVVEVVPFSEVTRAYDRLHDGAVTGRLVVVPDRRRMTRTGREIRVRRYPAGTVTDDDFEVVEVAVPYPGRGQVLVRNTWTSVDPGLRLRLRPDAPAGYFTSFRAGPRNGRGHGGGRGGGVYAPTASRQATPSRTHWAGATTRSSMPPHRCSAASAR